MIRHIAELWLTLAIVFLFGCLIGTLIQRAIAQSRAGTLQRRFAVFLLQIGRAVLWRLFPWRGYAPAIPPPVAMPTPAYGTAVAELGALVPHDLPPEEPDVEDGTESEPETPAKKPSAAAERRRREALARAETSGGYRPPVLAGPRNGRGDPLARIDGLSRKEANRLSELGIFHFGQVAAWTPAELTWVAAYLGRSEPHEALPWIASATALASGAVSVKSRRPPDETADAAEPTPEPTLVEEPAASENTSAPAEEGGPAVEETTETLEASSISEPEPAPVASAAFDTPPVLVEEPAIGQEAIAAGDTAPQSEAPAENVPSEPVVEPADEIRDRRGEPAA